LAGHIDASRILFGSDWPATRASLSIKATLGWNGRLPSI
jgi:predicted TIM-barrel fold metal-dependent hydrolase